MCHVDKDGGRSIDVACTGCRTVTRIRLEPDAHGREKALLRTEVARLQGRVVSIERDFDDFKIRMDIARTADAGRFMEMVVGLAGVSADSLRTATDLSRELDAIRWKIDALKDGHNPDDLATIAEFEAKVVELQKKVDHYETPNSRRGMPSLYDPRAKAFDKALAESCGRPMPPASLGPPMGHPGASHHLKPEKTVRYSIDHCLHCENIFVRQAKRPESKIFVEFGEDGRIHVWQLIVGRAWCSVCHRWSRAPDAPDLRGTCYGPAMLAKLLIMYALAATDRKLARYLESLLGTSACASTLWNGRRAAARVLEPFMKHLEKLLTATGWGHFDETTMRMFGKQGYLWLLTVACAAMVVARPSRGKGIFDEEFAFARLLAGVVDGYKVYEIILGEIQRCWRHVINNFKKAAVVSGDPAVKAAYHEFCALYERISEMDTAPKEQRDAIVRQALAIAGRLPEDHPSRIEIENAAKNLVTFLRFKDMPPTNNPGESDVRRVPVAQRNVRYQLRTEEGARVFSIILSFILTCDKQGIPLDKAFVALARGADPAEIFKVGQVAPNRWGGGPRRPKRPGKGPLDGPMPPECRIVRSGDRIEAAAAAEAAASVRAAAAAGARVSAAAEAAAGIRAAAAAELAAKVRAAASITIALQTQKAPSCSAATAVEPEASTTIALQAKKAPPAAPVQPRAAAAKARRRKAVPSRTSQSIHSRADRSPPAARQRRRRRRGTRPAPARLRHPPKPPPQGMRPCSLPQRRRPRPGNWHVPIKPSVPPPLKARWAGSPAPSRQVDAARPAAIPGDGGSQPVPDWGLTDLPNPAC